MRQLLTSVLDQLFPPRETALVVRSLDNDTLRTHFRPGYTLGIAYLSAYRDPAIAALITENKYHRNRHATKLLSQLLLQWLNTQPATPLVFVPMPLGAARERERGCNQVTEIIKQLPGDIDMVPAITRRTETAPQTTLSRTERLTNVAHAFVVTSAIMKIPPQSTVVLLDDVISTGATMGAARQELRTHLPADCKLICLAVAH